MGYSLKKVVMCFLTAQKEKLWRIMKGYRYPLSIILPHENNLVDSTGDYIFVVTFDTIEYMTFANIADFEFTWIYEKALATLYFKSKSDLAKFKIKYL